jgi:hypothetical protein
MSIKRLLILHLLLCGLLGAFVAIAWPSEQAVAQSSSQFCPSGQTLVDGFCLSPQFGSKPGCPPGYGPVSFGPTAFNCVGFSSAGAASQSLATTVQALANQTAYSTLDAVRERREEETQLCPKGTQRINGMCTPIGSNTAMGYAPEDAYAADIKPGRMVLKSVAPTTAAGLQVHPAVWIQAYGDYETRDQSTTNGTPTSSTGTPGTPLPPGGLSLNTSLDRVTRTAGFLSGTDFTILNITGNSDALIVGGIAGYTSTHVAFKNIVQTTDLTGPSAGVMAAYVRGSFSTDATFKADFLTQDQQFTDFAGGAFQVSGSNSIRLNTYSVASNVNYKIPVNNTWYVQPTAGVIYTDTVYATGAAALGLSNTTSTRLQGGAMFGANWTWSTVSINSTLTAIAYSNVSITGGAITQSGFSGGSIPTDQGLVYGQFLFANNYDFGRGFSASTGADVRFGNGVVGVGAKGGLRYQW